MQLPHSAIMPPIGEGRGAAWASLNIHFLWVIMYMFVGIFTKDGTDSYKKLAKFFLMKTIAL